MPTHHDKLMFVCFFSSFQVNADVNTVKSNWKTKLIDLIKNILYNYTTRNTIIRKIHYTFKYYQFTY